MVCPPLSAATAAVLSFLAAASAAASAPAESPAPVRGDFYVAVLGKDSASGAEDAPFATLTRAQAAVRARIARGLAAPLTVVIRGGGYLLSEPLVFGPEDSGADAFAVTWTAARGEHPLLSGGRRIAGWQRGQGELWTAQVPGVSEGNWYPRQLFIEGRRAVRARTPNNDDSSPCLQLKGAAIAKDLSAWSYRFAPGQLRPWGNLADVEAVVFGNWEITRKRFQSVDLAAGAAAMAPPHAEAISYNAPAAGRWFYLENAIEMLDRPGEWYLDRKTGVLSYWPLPGQDMAHPDTVMPVLATLLEIRGTAARPVRNLRFKGLTFSHTDWPPPAVGYMGIQAAHFSVGRSWSQPDYARSWAPVPAAIRMESAESCAVEDGLIVHLGGGGVEIGPRCRACSVSCNRIYDLGACGVQVGGPRDAALVPRDSQIANNHIYNCGVDYPGAVGVWIGFADGIAVAHNDIHDLPYSGISVGWQWKPQPTPVKNNRIEANHVHHVMARLGDGGGIYTLGFQPGTVIRANHIHDVLRSPLCQAAPNNGMFIDEGSKGFLFERNLIYKTAGEAVRFNQCAREWHTWKDNVMSGAAPPAAGTPDDAIARQTIADAGIEPPYRAKLLATFSREGR